MCCYKTVSVLALSARFDYSYLQPFPRNSEIFVENWAKIAKKKMHPTLI